MKCTKRDLKIEDDVYGHTPASISEPTAPKFIEVLTVDREWILTAKDENARKSRAVHQQFVGTVRSLRRRQECQLKKSI